jgi:hypothetical protein
MSAIRWTIPRLGVDGILDTGDTVVSLYPGPLHLANLLLGVERDLLVSHLVVTPATRSGVRAPLSSKLIGAISAIQI